MKNIITRIKFCLTTDSALDSILNAQERIAALEVYVQDLKWACDKLGYDPKVHGLRPEPNSFVMCQHKDVQPLRRP